MRARAPRGAVRCSHCGRASACRRWDRRRSRPAPSSRSWLRSSGWSWPSPARLRDAGDATLSSQRPETDAAHAELAQVRARPPADAATIVEPHLELRVDQVPLPKWHAETRQQAARLIVVTGGGYDRDLQPAQLVDLVVVDLRKYDLLAQAERVVAAAVEAVRIHAAEVADAGQRDIEQLVEEVPHAAAAKRGLDADRLALAQLEGGDRLAGLDQRRLLTGDRDHVADCRVERLVVVLRLADADVDHDLGDPRDLHDVLELEFLRHLRDDLFAVRDEKARRSLRLRAGGLGRSGLLRGLLLLLLLDLGFAH